MKIVILIAALCTTAVTASAQTYTELIQQSYASLDAGDLSAAEESLKSAMRLEPSSRTNYALLTNLGTIQRRLGKYEEAIFSYTAALNLHPADELILENRADLYAELGQLDNALMDYQTLLTINPSHEEALYHRGLLHLRSENFLAAESDFDQLINQNPETIKGYLGHALLAKVRKDYDLSEQLLNELIHRHPDNLLLYEERAELYYLMGRGGRAMTDLHKIFAGNTEPPADLYVLRGKVKLMQYEKASAALDFRRAAELGYDKSTVEALLKQTY